jgi:UDP-N-acetylmuramoyl-tripeptide--D-alanyl-D-alanine ligase
MTAATMMTLAQAHALLPASRLVGDGETALARVHSDTRSVLPGDLFVALKGERFDGHQFIAQARAAGAAAVLSAHELTDGGPGLQVQDTLIALQTLAQHWRARFHLPLIAVTGSNGKTTVTQMTAAILRAAYGEAAFSTQGNLNNHIGVPLTLLKLRQDDAAWHRAAVIELGMNHPGEIALLARIAQPTVVLVNNAQREHQEFMAGVEAVARENGSAIDALGPTGVAVFPADDAAHTPLWREMAGARRVLTFALGSPADVTAEAAWQHDRWQVAVRTPQGEASFALRVAGLHNVKNALAAAACALAIGVPLPAIVDGLEGFQPVKGRSRVSTVALHGRTVTLVDDSYNANPDSVRAAIDLLASLPGPQALLLGDMGEVGDRGPEFHAEVGAYARERSIATFWCVGDACAHAAAAYGAGARHFTDVPALIAALPALPASASLLVKGSRFMKMEAVVGAFASC